MTPHRWIHFGLALFAVVHAASAREPRLKTEHVFLITTDGLRWQEVFGGAEALLFLSRIKEAIETPARMLVEI